MDILKKIREQRKKTGQKGIQAQKPKNPYDLNQLTERNIDFSEAPKIMAEFDRLEEECKQKYGDDWWEHFVELTDPSHGIDVCEEMVNEHIYEGYRPFLTGDPESVAQYMQRYDEKMKKLFGPEWEQHVRHQTNDPAVNELLIKDALETGMWKELPKPLQVEYHERAGRKNG